MTGHTQHMKEDSLRDSEVSARIPNGDFHSLWPACAAEAGSWATGTRAQARAPHQHRMMSVHHNGMWCHKEAEAAHQWSRAWSICQ